MSPHLSPAATETLLRYAWQAAAGMYAVFSRDRRQTNVPAFEIDHEELIDRAVATTDEHAIKFAEACLREYSLNPKPIYLAAAADAASRLGLQP